MSKQSRGITLGAILVAALGSSTALAEENLVAGMDSDGGTVRIFDPTGDNRDLNPYGPTFTGGVRVAAGDISGDGVPDIITGSGPGVPAQVRIFDGVTLQPIMDLEPYGPQFTGGVFVAAGDVNGDGTADIVTGAGAGGGPRVRVFDGRGFAELHSFLAYDASFSGGVYVAAGDVNGDGSDDIITGPGPGGGPHVKVFSAQTGALMNDFFAYGPNFLGGVYVAAGDWDGDARADIITGPGTGDVPQVRVFQALNGQPLMAFFAYEQNFLGGVRVAGGDFNGDGLVDLVTAPGAGGAPLLTRYLAPQASNGDSVLAFDTNYLGGLFVANAVVISVLMRDGFE